MWYNALVNMIPYPLKNQGILTQPNLGILSENSDTECL